MFALAVLFGFIDKFHHLAGTELIWLFAIALVSLVVDYFSGILGAKLSGASPKSTFFGLVGMIVGTLILPPFGGLVGLFIGVATTEWIIGQRHLAVKAGVGSTVGSIAGILINLILAICFILLFILLGIN